MDDQDIEYAEANAVKVLETNVLHASDVIYWLNGATAENTADMRRLDRPMQLRLTNRPADATLLNSAGKTAILRKPSNDIVIGVATESDKTRPALPTYPLVGEAWDHEQRFNPARIDLTLGTGDGKSVVVYPSPLGTRVPAAGCLFGALHLDGGNAPLPWALLELTVAITATIDQVYRAQCDAAGDFTIALNRLPPLPESITGYDANLSVTTNTANTVDTAPDRTTYTAIQLQSASADTFGTDYTVTVIPGQRVRLDSHGKDYLAASTV